MLLEPFFFSFEKKWLSIVCMETLKVNVSSLLQTMEIFLPLCPLCWPWRSRKQYPTQAEKNLLSSMSTPANVLIFRMCRCLTDGQALDVLQPEWPCIDFYVFLSRKREAACGSGIYGSSSHVACLWITLGKLPKEASTKKHDIVFPFSVYYLKADKKYYILKR